MKRKFGIMLILMIIPYLNFAASAGSPGEYLATLGNGARALGMGAAFTGLADDASAIYFNPAGLAQVNGKQFYSLFAPIFPGLDVNLYSLAYVHPILGYGRVGVNWLGLFSGGYVGYDWRGYSTGKTYSESINTFLLSYATPMHKKVLSGGANIKLIFHSIEGLGRSYFGIGLDLAGFYKPYRFISGGIMIQNILPPRMSLSSTKEYYPINFRLGVAGHLLKQKLHIAADVMLIEPFATDKEKKGKMQFRYYTGVEYNFLKLLYARAGFNFKEVTGGIGVKYWGFNLDYAYAWNYQSLLASHQYLRISVIANLDEITFIKKIVPVSKIVTTGHIVMGQRDKKIIEDKTIDAKINYDIIDYHTSDVMEIPDSVVGLIVDNFYSFLNDENIKLIKFMIPVSESGFTVIYNKSLKNFLKIDKDIIVSFYLPGTYINLKEIGPIDVEKSSKFIKDALVHFKEELKLPLKKYEIILPEKSFIESDVDLYLGVIDNVLNFIKERKKVLGDIELIIPRYLMLIDNYKMFSRNLLEKIRKKYIEQIKNYSFGFEYDNPQDKNNIVEVANLNNYLKQYAIEIKNVFKADKDIDFYGNLVYDLKINNVKKQYFYALWLANGIKTLLFNGIKHIYVPLRPEKVTYRDVIEREKMLLEIDKMYPDLKDTNPKKYEEIIQKIDEKLNIKREGELEEFDILDEKEKKAGYYIFEIFNKYLFDELLMDKKEYIVTKNKANNETAIIYINNSNETKSINLKLLNLSKGVYKVEKILYSSELFYEKVDAPKVVESYEVNVVSELKINDKLLPTSITIIHLKLQPK